MSGFGKTVLAFCLLFAFVTGAAAQSRRQKPVAETEKTAERAKLAEQASQARATLIAKTNEWRESLGQVLKLQQAREADLKDKLEKQRQLFADGIISRRDLEKTELELAEASKRASETAEQMAAADQLIVEVEAEEELAKNQPAIDDTPVTRSGVRLIRYSGTTRFQLLDHIKIDEFFRNQFGRPLPISALGQSSAHNRLGFDHRGALDVALHPDSVEGQALMNHLRSLGIPFLAFRSAVPGSATGAHIHIGPPSHRIAPQN